MASIIQGKNLNLYYILNGYSYPACHATDCKISLTADTLETTTKNGLKGKTFDYQGKYTYSLSLNGITNLIDTANFSIFQDAIMQSNKLLFIFTDSESIQWSGTVLITATQLDSPVSAISTFSNDMLGDGELVKVTTGVTPPAAGSSVDIIDQFGTVLTSIPAPGSYAVLRFDAIDLRSFNPSTGVPITPQIQIIQAT